jgi:predicted ATP-dependent endonuclease of OLD family
LPLHRFIYKEKRKFAPSLVSKRKRTAYFFTQKLSKPMYLSQLEIKNFKSFENVTFEFTPKINIFTGVNNAGKTTVLEAIALWQECYKTLVRRAGTTVKGQFKKGDYILGSTYPTYVPYQEITSVRSPNYEDIFLRLDSNFPIVITATLRSEKGVTLSIPLTLSKADGNNYKIFCPDFKSFDFALFNNALFLKDPISGIQLSFAAPIANLLPAEERQMDAKIAYQKQSRATATVFRNRISKLYNRKNGDFDQFTWELKFILNNNTADIEFQFRTGKHNLYEIVEIKIGREDFKDISLLGSGTLQIIEILLSIFEDKKDLNLILLDEPDSHIHHTLQKRLLETLEKWAVNAQIFLTTHNESLIRSAKPEYVFHIEQQAIAQYQPITKQPLGTNKKGFQPNPTSPIILELTGTNSLDFVHALEADKLILVEGIDDALRIQKLLSLRIGDGQKYAFWVADGVGSYYSRIGFLKEMFKSIKNRQNLWSKSVLIMDKDDMSDGQRLKLINSFTDHLKLKTHVWDSYNFESVLLSDLEKLAKLLLDYILIYSELPAKPSLSVVQKRLQEAVERAIHALKLIYENNEELDRIWGKWKSRRELFTNRQLGINLLTIFEEDKDLKMNLLNYYRTCLNPQDFHKICRKEQTEKIIQSILEPEGLPFALDKNFDALFALMKDVFNKYEFVLSI